MSLKDKVKREGGAEEAVDLAEQIDEMHDIKALADTEAGKKLVALLLQDVVNAVSKIRSGRATNSLAEFQSYAADIEANLGLAKLLINAKDNEEFLHEQLKDTLSQ